MLDQSGLEKTALKMQIYRFRSCWLKLANEITHFPYETLIEGMPTAHCPH